MATWAERDFDPCSVFWGRGLSPSQWAPVSEAPYFHPFAYGTFAISPLPHNCTYATDASGGEHTKDVRLRRCGFGAVHFSVEEGIVVILGGIGNSIGGPSFDQSVPRAELSAIIFVLQHSTGFTHFVIDAQIFSTNFNWDCKLVYAAIWRIRGWTSENSQSPLESLLETPLLHQTAPHRPSASPPHDGPTMPTMRGMEERHAALWLLQHAIVQAPQAASDQRPRRPRGQPVATSRNQPPRPQQRGRQGYNGAQGNGTGNGNGKGNREAPPPVINSKDSTKPSIPHARRWQRATAAICHHPPAATRRPRRSTPTSTIP